jgi:hypothetical protein
MKMLWPKSDGAKKLTKQNDERERRQCIYRRSKVVMGIEMMCDVHAEALSPRPQVMLLDPTGPAPAAGKHDQGKSKPEIDLVSTLFHALFLIDT